jgi:hypothetical protein
LELTLEKYWVNETKSVHIITTAVSVIGKEKERGKEKEMELFGPNLSFVKKNRKWSSGPYLA